MRTYTLWYTRKDGEVRGPFPRAVIAQYLLLNRLHKDDEVSIDQEHWQSIASVEELVPTVIKGTLSQPANQYLIDVAKRGADERLAIDRRQQGDAAAQGEHRGGNERRAAEPQDLLEHRRVKTAAIVAARQNKPVNTILAVVIVLAIAGVLVALALNYTPQPSGPEADCAAAPAAKVNWSNCSLQGGNFDHINLQQAVIRNADLTGSTLLSADLQGADMAYANLSLTNLSRANLRGAQLIGAKLNGSDLSGVDLSGADLSYADLSSANLSGANLAGTKLDQTVWMDKTICARGSVGQCLAGR